MEPKTFLAAQLWYGLSQGVAAFINPFLPVFFSQLGFTGAQIGVLSALRPWISAPCGSLVAALADRWQAHRMLLVGTFAACILAQGAMALPAACSFGTMLALTVVASAVWTPSSIIADASVMAASTHPGDYGKARTWASLTWTLLSPVAGFVNSRFGIRTGILCYVVGSACAIPTALALPVQALRKKVAPVIERAPSMPAKEEAQPLLEEEEGLPPTPATAATAAAARGPALSKAIAIIRYIEAITEMGVVPPIGPQIYGFSEISTPFAARHLDPQRAAESPLAPEQGTGMLPDTSYQAVSPQPSPPPSPHGPPTPGMPGGLQRGADSGSPHATSMPRPISAESLGRVESLAEMAGVQIPRIRTRPQLRPRGSESSDVEDSGGPSSPSADADPGGPSPDQDEERVFHHGGGLELGSAVQHTQHTQQRQAEEKEGEQGGGRSPFGAPDLQRAFAEFLQPQVPPPPLPPGMVLPGTAPELTAGAAGGGDAGAAGGGCRGGEGQPVRLVMDGAPSASLLLQDVRRIAAGPSGAAAAAAALRAAAVPHAAQQVHREGDQAQQAERAASAASLASAGAGEVCSPVPTRQAATAGLGEPVGEPRSPGAHYRSAAVQRLVEIFGGGKTSGASAAKAGPARSAAEAAGGGAARGGPVERSPQPSLRSAASTSTEGSGTLGALGTSGTSGGGGLGRAGLAAEPAGVEGPGVVMPGSVTAWSLGGFYTPVQRYIQYRRDKLEQRRAREGAAEPAAPQPEPLTAADVVLGMEPELQRLAGPEAAEVTPELMREAVALESSSVTDPSESLVISMLGKKLERMAREQERAAAWRRRRAAREPPAAAATRAAAAPPAVEAEAPEAQWPGGGAPVGRLAEAQQARPHAKVLIEPGPEAGTAHAAGTAQPPPQGLWSGLRRLLGDPEVATFFVLATLMGFGHGVLGSYLFMFLAQLGGSEALMGYVLTANALPELPVFFFFGDVLRLLGMHTLLLLSAGALSLRLLAYLVLPAWGVWWVIPIETLHAITFACGWSACAINSSKISPRGLESTTQGIFQGLWTGVGSGTGGLVGGLLYHHLGPEALFRLSGLATGGGAVLCAAVFVALRWRRKTREAREAGYEELPSGGPGARMQ